MQVPRVVGLATDIVPEHHMPSTGGGAVLGADHSSGSDGPERSAFGRHQILPQMVGGGSWVGAAARSVAAAEGVAGRQRLHEMTRAVGCHQSGGAGQRRRRAGCTALKGLGSRQGGGSLRGGGSGERQGQAGGKDADGSRGEFLRHRSILTSRTVRLLGTPPVRDGAC